MVINEYLLASDVARVAARLLNSRDSLPALAERFGDEPMRWLGYTLSRLPAGDEAEMALVNVGESLYDMNGASDPLQRVSRLFAAKAEWYSKFGDVPSRTDCINALSEFERELDVVAEYGYEPVDAVFERDISREADFGEMMMALLDIRDEPAAVTDAASSALAYAAD